MPANADRNLLFGILALQMDFVTRDQLVAAMNAWVLDKSKPLGDILRDQGALADDTHALLEALVQKHLSKYDNDPRRSLAALSSVEPLLKQQLAALPDAAVQQSIAHVGAARRGTTDPDPDRTGPPQSPPSAVRY